MSETPAWRAAPLATGVARGRSSGVLLDDLETRYLPRYHYKTISNGMSMDYDPLLKIYLNHSTSYDSLYLSTQATLPEREDFVRCEADLETGPLPRIFSHRATDSLNERHA